MSRYIVINAKKTPKVNDVPDAPIYHTHHAGEAIEIIRDICQNDPYAEIHVYGGDGSVFESVNAVMASNCPETVALVIHPFGTGNDFARNFPDADHAHNIPIDLIRFNEHYAANEINIGFDCDVVATTQKVKKIPFLKGSLAYMIGVILTLFKKMGRDFDITYIDADGKEGTLQSKLLLCLLANGGFYGGGFHCAPLASLNDGLLEMITVNKISRIKFLLFFLKYRKGIHISPDGTVPEKFRNILTYRRVRSCTFKAVGNICADGELFTYNDLAVSVENNAFRISLCPKTK